MKLRRGARVTTFEHSMLRTATLCLIAFGAVMVYSASSGTSLLSDGGDSSYYLKRYVASAVLGLLVLALVSRWGLTPIRKLAPAILLASIAGLLLVLMPGFSVEANGARRWLGAGSLQIQPSEVAKLGVILYAAGMLAARPERARSIAGVRPILIVGGAIAGLVVIEPDLGTAIVISLGLAAILVAGGMKLRHLATIGGTLAVLALIFSLAEPYRRDRLTSFLNPWADSEGAGFQSVQAMIAIGSGGPFGVGLGESVQKLFYLPEAHTDMILAVIGEELGFAGIAGVLFLYGMIAYAGLRVAQKARDLYLKLLAAGITSLILTQATVNFFAVLGVLPLTGVPLPFISYGNSNLIVMLGAMGLLLNIAQQGAPASQSSPSWGQRLLRLGRARHLRVLEGGKHAERERRRAARPSPSRSEPARGSRAARPQAAIRKLSDANDRDRSRGNRRSRGAGARDRRRAAG